MKVVVKNNIIETSLITNIEIKEDNDVDWISYALIIYFIGGDTKPLYLECGFCSKGLPHFERDSIKAKNYMNQIIEFIDKHSDKNDFPFPKID